jgi:hypothetical protein
MKRAILCLALVAGTAHAEFLDGNKLLSDMKGSHGFQMSALGYVMGVADTLQGVTVCMPPSVLSGQVLDMVRNYLEANPAVRHFSADMIVSDVLKRTFPCAATRPPGRQL